MNDISYFYFDDFALAVDRSSFLVTVFQPEVQPSFRNSVTELPSWIFHSRLTIWLGENGKTPYERSINGEAVRVTLLARLAEEKLHCDDELDYCDSHAGRPLGHSRN